MNCEFQDDDRFVSNGEVSGTLFTSSSISKAHKLHRLRKFDFTCWMERDELKQRI